MESQVQAASAPASDSENQKRLAEFVAENRQHLPPLPSRPPFSDYTPTPESDRLAAERAAARHKAELYQRYTALVAAAGERYRGCTLSSFQCRELQQRKVIAELREYAAGDAIENVILHGPVGTGKDHLAFAICCEAIRAGRTVRWVNGQQWFGAVRDAMDTDKSEASLIQELSRPDVLCLSDPLPPVGALTQFQATMLYRLVDARYSKNVPTVCTINVGSDEEADERMGAATWDRLTHGAWKLHCNWPTYRKPAREVR